MSFARKLFAGLPGTWSLDRHIDGKGQMFGQAVFTRIDEVSLGYEESGNLRLENGETFSSMRNYIYRLNGETIEIHYDDPARKNEIMHELNFGIDGSSSHVHLCGEDSYAIEFKSDGNSEIKIEYDVRGPKKDYRIKSVLSRKV